MPLNALGDMLGGFFAPLAFLWLFTATWLQRQELQLQREELANTREVLADQMREMERTANENKEQTVIMSRTLQATTERSVYDSFNLELYYLARRLRSQLASSAFYYKVNEQIKAVRVLELPSEHEISLEYADTVDLLYEDLWRRSKIFVEQAKMATPGHDAWSERANEALDSIEHSIILLDRLMNKYGEASNALVNARMSHLEVVGILNNLRQTAMYLNRALR